MVRVIFSRTFGKNWSKLNNSMKEQITKQIIKIKNNPELGKPMMYARKGTREVYISNYRLSYTYFKDEDKIEILDIYHKDEQ